MAKVKVGYIWESRLTSTLELVPEDFLFEIPWPALSSKHVTLFTNCCHIHSYEVLAFILEPVQRIWLLVELLILFFLRDQTFVCVS